MLPSRWQSERLLVADVTEDDLDACHESLMASQDAASLDPAFRGVPLAEIRGHIVRSQAASGESPRSFQMQAIRHTGSGDMVGYWHLMRVPGRSDAVGVSIMLIRPEFRRQGHGRALVAGALSRLEPSIAEVWARVYLANPRALEFWASVGFRTLVKHQGAFVASPSREASVILCAVRGSR